MLKYRVIRSFVAVWCAVCVAYVGTRMTLGVLFGSSGSASTIAETITDTSLAEKIMAEVTKSESESESVREPEPEPELEPEPEETATSDNEHWTQETVEIEVEEQEESYTPSLYEYLSWFTCGSCRRNCSLSNPRCHNGSMLAEAKAQEYYSTYG